MKIIAKTREGWNTHWLVEVSDDDIRKIVGRDVKVEIGAVFDVSAHHSLIQRHRDSQKELNRAALTLRALADLCEQQAPTLIMQPDPQTEGSK